MEKLLIMVPCYNCERQAVRVVGALDEFVRSFSSTKLKIDKIVFVDNHSRDNTVSEIQRALKGVQQPQLFSVVQNEKNYGLGGSHKSVFTHALQNGIDYVAVVHGDNQADARELTKLIAESQSNQGATVLGSRFSSQSRRTNYAFNRIWGNQALNQIYSLLLGRRIEDLGSGLNIFHMQPFKNRQFLKFDDHFTFNMDVLIYLVAHHHNTRFFPISWKTEDEVSNAISIKVGSRALRKIIAWLLFKEKIWAERQNQNYTFRVLHDG